MRRSAIKRKTGLRRSKPKRDVARTILNWEMGRQMDKLEREIVGSTMKRTRLRSRSPRKRTDDAKYAKAKAEHFAEHPDCQFPMGNGPGAKCPCSLTRGDAMDLHHKAGRNGPLLYAKQYFATACRAHHELAKSDPKGSRLRGWVIDVSSEEVRRLRQEELLAN